MANFLDLSGLNRFLDNLKNLFLKNSDLQLALEDNVNIPKYVLNVNYSTMACSLLNYSNGEPVTFSSVASYVPGALKQLYILVTNGASSMYTSNAVLFNAARVDASSARLVLSSVVESAIMHIADLQDTGSGLVGTYRQIGIPSSADEISYDSSHGSTVEDALANMSATDVTADTQALMIQTQDDTVQAVLEALDYELTGGLSDRITTIQMNGSTVSKTGHTANLGTVLTSVPTAGDISYQAYDQDWNVQNVSDAIDSLYVEGYKVRDYEKSSSTIDLNTLVNPGTYNLLTSDTLTNSPLTYGLLRVYFGFTPGASITSNVICQELYQQTANNTIFSRYSTDSGATWSDWLRKAGFEYYVSWASGAHDADNPLPGTVWCRCGSSYTTNLPVTSGYGMLTTYGRLSGAAYQTFAHHSTSGVDGFYIRIYTNSQWYPWVNVMGSGSSPSYTNGDEVSY